MNIFIFHYNLLQDIKCGSLCYTVGPFWLSILFVYSNVYILIPSSMDCIESIDGFWYYISTILICQSMNINTFPFICVSYFFHQ